MIKETVSINKESWILKWPIRSLESIEAYISAFVDLQVYKPHQYVKADQE